MCQYPLLAHWCYYWLQFGYAAVEKGKKILRVPFYFIFFITSTFWAYVIKGADSKLLLLPEHVYTLKSILLLGYRMQILLPPVQCVKHPVSGFLYFSSRSKCRKQTCVQDLVEEAADKRGSDVQFREEQRQAGVARLSQSQTLLVFLVDAVATQHALK